MHPETDYRLEGFNYRNFGAQTMAYVIMRLMASAQSFRSVAIPFKIHLIPNLFVVIPAQSCSVASSSFIFFSFKIIRIVTSSPSRFE